MKDEDGIKDWRSTGRRKARRELFNNYVPFKCVGYHNKEFNLDLPCGKTTIEPPKDAPPWFDEIWPEENRVLNPQALQADHETKDLTMNYVEYLNWRCSSCHKNQDSQTEKGEATIKHDSVISTEDLPLEWG